MPSTLEKALRGFGEGLTQVGLMSLQDHLQTKRLQKLAEIQTAASMAAQQAGFAHQEQRWGQEDALAREQMAFEQAQADRKYELEQQGLGLEEQYRGSGGVLDRYYQGSMRQPSGQSMGSSGAVDGLKAKELAGLRQDAVQALRDRNEPVTPESVNREMALYTGADIGPNRFTPADFPELTMDAVKATAEKKGMTPDQVISEYARGKGASASDVMGALGWSPEMFQAPQEPAGTRSPPVANPSWKMDAQAAEPAEKPPEPRVSTPVEAPPGLGIGTRSIGAPQAAPESFGTAIGKRVSDAMANGSLPTMPLVFLLMARNTDLPPDQKAAVEAAIAQRQPSRPRTIPGGSAVMGGR